MDQLTASLSTLRVCQDCYLAHHGILEDGDPDHVPDREPLGEVPDGVTLTAGLLREAHDPWCDDPDTCSIEGEGCEHHTFSWSPCDGCGSTLGGDRHALTMHDDLP